MNDIRHQETSRDSLYEDISQNLETIYTLWTEGNMSLRFSIPILCAAKLEAFINVAGKLKVEHWDNLERKCSFKEKCKSVFMSVGLAFDPDTEPNKTAIGTFEIRNSLVHPKMKLGKIDEYISHEEYKRRNSNFGGDMHHLRYELTKEKVAQIKSMSDLFTSKWGTMLFDGDPDYWLSGGATRFFTPVIERNS